MQMAHDTVFLYYWVTSFTFDNHMNQFWVSADTDIDPIQLSFELIYLNVCWPDPHYFVLHTVY